MENLASAGLENLSGVHPNALSCACGDQCILGCGAGCGFTIIAGAEAGATAGGLTGVFIPSYC